jgi:hypothetical protein
VEGPPADGAIGGVDLGGGPSAVAAEHHPAGPTPAGQGRRVALPAAVMWRQQDGAIRGRLVYKDLQSRRLQIAGQENALSSVFHPQHDAVGVVVGRQRTAGRVQNSQGTRWAAVEPVARADFTNRDGLPDQGIMECANRRGRPFEHDGRHIDCADREPVEQRRQGVEMVDVGMGKDDGVEMRDPPRPEKSADDVGRMVRGAHLPGVVEQGLAVRQFDQGRRAVPDGQERALQGGVFGGDQRDAPATTACGSAATARPGPPRRKNPPTTSRPAR